MEIVLNNTPTARGELLLPLVGLWRADVVLAAAGDSGKVTPGQAVELAFPSTIFKGTAVQAGPERGLLRAVVLPGKGKLSQPVRPKVYQEMNALGILRDTLSEVGEELDGSSRLDYSPPQWVRMGGPAYGAVAALVRAAKGAWRCTPEGKVWAGEETWPEYAPQTLVLEERVAEVVLELDEGLKPGVVLKGYGRVVEVRHVWGPSVARTEVRYDPA
ncbi:hypothetical protein KQ693_05905 [Thermus sp. PS18]|uniref:hypothetical protein n=1 Tax=Thermus sp. PS18 TaxID=2849039 RepID=UPI002263E0A9|nr:hypothetical protein [Thermus sp. PS18]UZX16563.1 hypothetical protein KQ693_05905 [Thermus sp. PS18]